VGKEPLDGVSSLRITGLANGHGLGFSGFRHTAGGIIGRMGGGTEVGEIRMTKPE
jgi:hypothetical protein